MKLLPALFFLSTMAAANAALVSFDVSPPGTDDAVGLSPANEAGAITNSTGSGNEIGSGIVFDTETLTLELSLGYGSAFGFSNLTGPATAAHIHGPAPTNTSAGVVIDLAGIHLPATNAASGGSIVGSVVLTTNQAADLLAGLHYINIHTLANGGGEIRGQLIPVNTFPTVTCPPATTVQCTGSNGTPVTLSAIVSDIEGHPLTVTWTVNGVAMQTNTVAAGNSTNASTFTLSGIYQIGVHPVSVSITDGLDVLVCELSVSVVDAAPPVISSASVTPNVLWPPNHKMIPVTLTAVAADLCGDPTCKIKSIRSNQGGNAKGSGNKSPDWLITGDLTAELRAERQGKGKNGRTYTITLECTDSAGNAATRDVTVLVPHDQGSHGNANGNGNGNAYGHGNGNGNPGGGNSTTNSPGELPNGKPRKK